MQINESFNRFTKHNVLSTNTCHCYVCVYWLSVASLLMSSMSEGRTPDTGDTDNPRLLRVQRSAIYEPQSLYSPSVVGGSVLPLTGDYRSLGIENRRLSENNNAQLDVASLDRRSSTYRHRYLPLDVSTAAAAASLALRAWDLRAAQRTRHGSLPRTNPSGHSEQVGTQQKHVNVMAVSSDIHAS